MSQSESPAERAMIGYTAKMNLSSLCARHEKKAIQRCAEESKMIDLNSSSLVFAFCSVMATRSLKKGNSRQSGHATLKFSVRLAR